MVLWQWSLGLLPRPGAHEERIGHPGPAAGRQRPVHALLLGVRGAGSRPRQEMRRLPEPRVRWAVWGLALLGAFVILFTILAVGVSRGVRTMGYAKPGRVWFWRRG